MIAANDPLHAPQDIVAGSAARRIAAMEPVRIGATGAAMPLAAMLAWVKAAPAGAEIVYAQGGLPKWSKTVPNVRDLAMRDIVVAFQVKGSDPAQYVIRRTAKPYSEPPEPVRIAREIAPRTDDMARLLTVIRAYARKGAPCPCNRDLAKMAGLSNGNRASYLIKKLIADRHIMREDSRWAPGRIVTILPSLEATSVTEGVLA